MTAPDRAAAVEVTRRVLDESSVGPSMTAEAVVAAQDAAKLLRRPDEAGYVAALEAIAERAERLARIDQPAWSVDKTTLHWIGRWLKYGDLEAPVPETGSGEA